MTDVLWPIHEWEKRLARHLMYVRGYPDFYVWLKNRARMHGERLQREGKPFSEGEYTP